MVGCVSVEVGVVLRFCVEVSVGFELIWEEVGSGVGCESVEVGVVLLLCVE